MKELFEKRKYVFAQTLLVHARLPESRIASALSMIDILVALFYGGILKFNPRNPYDEERDRLIISKGHGAIALYPILADFGFFPPQELDNIPDNGFGAIPDPNVPGIEAVCGSLGNGLGIGCGMAVSLKLKRRESSVVIICGDGELTEGSSWEAIMFAAQNRLDNVTLIVDYNKKFMLGQEKNIINLHSLSDKFSAFGWEAVEVDGHSIKDLIETLSFIVRKRSGKPKVVIAHTVKGKGIEKLERSDLSHVMSLNKDEIESILGDL